MHVDLGALFQRLVAQEPVDAFGGDRAVADRGGQQMRAHDVAADEHALFARDLVVLVRGDRALAVVEFFQTGEVHRLADGGDDQVGGDVFLGALDDLDLEFGPDELRLALRHAQRRGAAVGIAHHHHRREAAANGDAFGLCLLDFVLVRLHFFNPEHRGERHFGALLGRDRGDVVARVAGDRVFRAVLLARLLDVAEAPRHGGDVDRGVAAADDHHALADMAHAAVVERLQERGRGDDVRRLVARAGQRAAGLGAEAEEHRVELGADLIHGDLGADAAGQPGLHADVEDALDLRIENIARRAKAGNAVAHHAAEFRMLVENGDLVPLAPQLVGADSPAGPPPITATFLPVAVAGLS